MFVFINRLLFIVGYVVVKRVAACDSQHTGFYHNLSRGNEAGRTSALSAHRSACVIKLTLFTQSDPQRGGQQTLPALIIISSIECLVGFVCFYGTVTIVKMLEVKITEDIRIGGKNPCFIIAEVGQNHQGDIEVAKKLIKAAKVGKFLCI